MNIVFWIIQSLVALTFLYSGVNKSIYSSEHLVAAGQTGVEGLPAAEIKFIGIIEIFGAFGLILPGLLNIMPVITPLAAVGFAIIMLLAARIHIMRKEPKNVFFQLYPVRSLCADCLVQVLDKERAGKTGYFPAAVIHQAYLILSVLTSISR